MQGRVVDVVVVVVVVVFLCCHLLFVVVNAPSNRQKYGCCSDFVFFYF